MAIEQKDRTDETGATRADDRTDDTRAVDRRGERGTLVDRGRQRDEFGGFNWGAAFFGWLVAVGLAAILTAIVAAAGAAIGLTSVSSADAQKNAATIGAAGAIALIVVLMIAYYAGGYVAGRMSRFDGGRQGFAVWVIGLLLVILFAIAGAVFGTKYNVLSALNLPRIPIKEGTLATGGAITLAAIVLGTLLTSVLGGRVGHRYHLKVDRAAVVED